LGSIVCGNSYIQRGKEHLMANYFGKDLDRMLIYVLYHPQLNVLVLSSADAWPGLEYIGEL
jgi:hypothetical protein